jgi:hypothetical protein
MAFSSLAAQEVGGGAGFAHGAVTMPITNSWCGNCDVTANFLLKNMSEWDDFGRN